MSTKKVQHVQTTEYQLTGFQFHTKLPESVSKSSLVMEQGRFRGLVIYFVMTELWNVSCIL